MDWVCRGGSLHVRAAFVQHAHVALPKVARDLRDRQYAPFMRERREACGTLPQEKQRMGTIILAGLSRLEKGWQENATGLRKSGEQQLRLLVEVRDGPVEEIPSQGCRAVKSLGPRSL